MSFVTNSVLSYLRFFAKKAIIKHKPTIIGIAGSVGKSSTKNAIEAILKDHFKIVSVGNSETGIPLGILGLTPSDYSKKDWLHMLGQVPFGVDFLRGTQFLITEMGIDDPYPPKNMEYLLTILKPDIALSLNVSATHTMQFEKVLSKKEKALPDTGTREILLEAIANDDTKILTKSDCKIGIYNADDQHITNALDLSNKTTHTTFLSFGEKNTNDVSYGDYKVTLNGTIFTFFILSGEKHTEETLHFKNIVLPKEYRELFAAAILATLQTGLSLKQISTSLEMNFTLPKSRSSLLSGIHESVIIDSSYNASKAATTAFLDLVDILKKETNRPIVFVFGDMRELGDESQIEHTEVAEKAKGIVDYLYLVGPLTRQFVLPISQQNENSFKEIRWFENAGRVGEFLKQELPQNALVLVKGSQNTIYLEEAVKMILKNKSDEKLLCRQDGYWKTIKKPYL